MIDNRTSEILLALYEATLDPAKWQDALQRIAQSVGACAGVMEFVSHRKGEWQALGGFGYDLDACRSDPKYSDWPEHDPWARCIELEPDVDLLVGTKHVAADEVRKSTFRNDYLLHLGADWRDVLAITPKVGNDTLGVFALYRSASLDDFGFRELETLEALKPHILNALTIAARFENFSIQINNRDQLLNEQSQALFVLSKEGRVSFANRSAEALLGDKSAAVTTQRGRLCLADPAANLRFQNMLASHLSPSASPLVGGGTESSMVWTDMTSWRSFALCIAPKLQGVSDATLESFGVPASIVVSVSQFQVDAHGIATRMQHAYELTDAETLVLRHLLDGARPADICEANGVSMNTVRAQLKALFRKADVSTQTELVRQALAGFAV